MREFGLEGESRLLAMNARIILNRWRDAYLHAQPGAELSSPDGLDWIMDHRSSILDLHRTVGHDWISGTGLEAKSNTWQSSVR